MLSNNSYETKVIKDMANKTIKIKVKTPFPLHGVKVGEEVLIEVDANDIPLDKNWRRRLRDAAIDGNIEIQYTAEEKVAKEKAKAEKDQKINTQPTKDK